MMKNRFWKFYAVFVVLMMVLCSIGIIRVKGVLQEYEDSQPNIVVEQQIEVLREAAVNGTLERVVTLQDLNQAPYDKSITGLEGYKERFQDVAEFTYKTQTGGYSESSQSFSILADEEPIAIVELVSSKEERKLGILTISDWGVKSITPVVTLTNYEYVVEVPIGFTVYVNGYKMVNPEVHEGSNLEIYRLEKLYSEPDIEIYDTYGVKTDFDIVDNTVVPVVYSYRLSLPETFKVYVDGVNTRVYEDTLSDNGVSEYNIMTACDRITLVDNYGNTIEYTGNEDIQLYDYRVVVPDNYVVKVEDLGTEAGWVETYSNSKYDYCKEYCNMPLQVVYELKDTLVEMDIEIYDNLGNKVDYIMENGKVEITEQAGLDKMPDNLEIDVLDIAKTWSKFMTQDLAGPQNGFNTIKKYLIKDSYMYNVAYKWATGIDITLTSAHHREDTYFTDEKVTNFIQYSEDLFSCDISFVKHMYLYKRGNYVEDETNSTFYFYRNTAGDKVQWVILDIQEIIAK